MKKSTIVVVCVTLYMLLFHASPFLGVPDEIITGLFLLSPILVIYMAVVILKNGKPSGYSFNERFYDDWDYTRNGKE
ncbi:hypothetical protein [Flavihumibacter fluvii]|uniref:hypothetical protein n=1 Tax=Flavihumibacter fluvii TaxID=2838157 RepID=UPI001BDF31D0|nr:hypothetical protein [Flavihumibacter fluvii]ULQ54766.1 hypothetical protein KJS93_10590 [Flavihumibacter fluvii]